LEALRANSDLIGLPLWTFSEREAFRIGIGFGGIVGLEERSENLSDFQAPDEFS
jgi:hypothetical protein